MPYFLNPAVHNMSLLDKFIKDQKSGLERIRTQDLKFLLAVSGGLDSVVMCDLFYKAGLDFDLAHCNFQLRAEESDRDEAFVRKLGQHYGKTVRVERFDTHKYAGQHKISTQLAARDLRYAWFGSFVLPVRKCAGIVTAHHGDDNLETVLMNLFRGTGIKGMTGIPEQQYLTFRPLLRYRRREILEYANQNSLAYVEDSSNQLSDYTRNFFRNELLPGVRKVFPQAEENLLKSIQHFKDAEQIYSTHIKAVQQKLCKPAGSGPEKKFAILDLKKLHPLNTWIWEFFKDYGFTPGQTQELIKLMDASNGAYVRGQRGFKVIRNRQWLVVSPEQGSPDPPGIVTIGREDRKVQFAGGVIEIEVAEASKINIHNNAETALLDMGEISFPLLVRRCRQGDYFYPLGMRKKKKLSRFFIDQKLSPEEKQGTWVIESDRKIIWVMGMRIDDRCKILPSTKQFLKLSWLR